jgi:hypothetical protein
MGRRHVKSVFTVRSPLFLSLASSTGAAHNACMPTLLCDVCVCAQVFYRGRTLTGKLDRICSAFSAHQHDIPNFANDNEVQVRA